MGKYDKIFEPLQVTPNFTMKNRLVKSPQSSWLWNKDGTAEGSRAVDMYESMAKGGAGAIVVAAILWETASTGIYLMSNDDKYIPGMKELTDRVHKYDCRIVGQLHHMGPSAWRAPDDHVLPIGASSLEEDEIPTPPPFGSKTRGLSVEEIHEKEQHMIDAAYRLYQGGFDGVEVHAAHGYFLNSWLSPIWNKRDDEYGWADVKNRTRIMKEIYDGIREKCGPDFLIGTRINGQEWSPQYQGITPKDAAETAVELENIGYQYISISGYGYGPLSFRYCPDYFPYPEPEPHMKPYMDAYLHDGILLEGAKAVKAAVKHVPIATAGRIDFDLGERILERGDADILNIGRQFWADPEFPNKLKEGRLDDIFYCTRCASCEDPVTQPRICRVNPGLGRRDLWPEEHPATTRKKVMVIGGGPAGLEAALTASKRGHDVTLYEKSSKLGGRIELASMIKGNTIEDVMPVQDYLVGQVQKSNVKVKLKTEVTPATVKKEAPDAVVIANSSPYYVPNVPGIDRKNVMTVPQMSKLAQKPLKMFGPQKLASMAEKFFPVGKRIIIIGAGAEGAQGAEWLKKLGKDIVLVGEDEDVGGLIPLKYKERIEPWFKEVGVEVVKNAELVSVDKKGVTVKTPEGERFIDGDTVMIMLSERYDPAFYNSVKDLAPEVYEVGSERGGDNAFIKHALLDGRTVGMKI